MIRGQDIFRFSRIYEVLSISKSLDDILNVSESMVTPLPTPKKSSASIQEPILEVKENPLDFTLKYQSDWNQSEVRTIEAYISGIYPKNPDHWKIKICPICKEWDSNLACNCNQVRELGFYLSLHLKSKPNSPYAITAFVCGPEGNEIMDQADISGILNDQIRHKLTLIKVIPVDKTGLGFTFLVLKIS